MKKISIFALVFIISFAAFSQEKFQIPDFRKAVVQIEIPSDKWDVNSEDGLVNITPKDDGNDSRIITKIWGCEKSESENYIEEFTKEAFSVVEASLQKVVWKNDFREFNNNGIKFKAKEGVGYYENSDGSVDPMSTSIFLFYPDENNVMVLLYFGTIEAYNKWGASLDEIVYSIALN